MLRDVADASQIFVLSACGVHRAEAEAERDWHINRIMARFYRDGIRRFRTIRLQRNGDGDRFVVLGWRA